ncbi:uncharacterized protein DFL_004436 [Arthrobotrys flagrans]|uniref:Uncharacterized protein n=1 Tax=Arthrobotrys flagrans TaxID=97331 RepID=A0A437A4U2_ARTFL|nr:hypothetical protein DFL_004436 [Arthrobotrys flagrans]
MAQEIKDQLEFRRCISEPIRYPLQPRLGPIPTADKDSEGEGCGDKSCDDPRPFLGVSEIGARAMQRIPYIMNDSNLNLELGSLFAPPKGTSNILKDQKPLMIAIPGNPKPFLAIFCEDLNISLIRESFYEGYFAPNGKSTRRSIPTEYGILDYDARSIVKFNKDSPLYVLEKFTKCRLFNINQEGSMQAIGITMIPFCLPHDTKKTHWIQALVVKELFPWNKGVQENVMAVLAPHGFAAGITYAGGTRPIPMLHDNPIGLFLQEGSLQVWVSSQHYTPKEEDTKMTGTKGSPVAPRRHFGCGVYFSDNSAFNVSKHWYWECETCLRNEPLGDLIAVITLFRQLKSMTELRGIMRKVKGITVHLTHMVALGLLEAVHQNSSVNRPEFQELWSRVLKKFFKDFEAIGWPARLKWVGAQDNGKARKLAVMATQDVPYTIQYSNHKKIEAACDELARVGTFDIKGIEHDENTPITKVHDADWGNMGGPPFLSIRYEEPFDSLMRQLEIAEAEHDPHYNNEATPEGDIFNPANYPG